MQVSCEAEGYERCHGSKDDQPDPDTVPSLIIDLKKGIVLVFVISSEVPVAGHPVHGNAHLKELFIRCNLNRINICIDQAVERYR
jgi:hypothetical protein